MKKSSHQKQQPGNESRMHPRPEFKAKSSIQTLKFNKKAVLITGGDSGIGRAISVAFATEGADIGIIYYNEHKDARETKALVEKEGRRCLIVSGDVSKEKFCRKAVKNFYNEFGRIDVLINNAAMQFPQKDIEYISEKQLVRTFSTNIFSLFFMIKAVMPHLKKGSSIINTASVTAYRGSKDLLDYSATKGAIVAFTRSLSTNLARKNIRVNAVAPGPIWTPLIVSTFPKNKIAEFGKDTPMKRPGQPNEVAGAYVFLASEDASYITGQIIHPNGGEIVNT